MKTGTIRVLEWPEAKVESGSDAVFRNFGLIGANLGHYVEEATAVEAGTEAVPFPTASPSSAVKFSSAVDEAKLLLRIAAEIEGALLVQYLYAAYSILPGLVVTTGTGSKIQSDDWYDTLRDIAKQEMGHLITVQNLLLSLNAPPHLDRENFPIKSSLYPFPFQLEAPR